MPLSSMTNLGFAASFFSNSLRPRLQNASTSSERGAKSHVHVTAPRMTLSKRELRKQIISSDQYNRKGFQETREAAEGVITKEFTSELFKELLDNANTVVRGDVTLRLAKAYGFCWGVERAVAMAYETRRRYPTERIWITNEIIHNPVVNQRMRDMGIYILELEGMKKDLSGIGEGDVVILPAFGASLEELQHLHSLKCRIVDTTCPWVSKVWTTLDKHRQANCTSIIHGKWKHEETVATASFAEKYLIVLNMDEAKYVSSYILHGGDKAEFSNKFKNAMSTDFDPDTDLEAVGIANQTTMLKSETTAIGKLFERTMMQKYGPAELNKRFVAYDTICDATQERQDAMYELLADKDNLDLMLVVGGFNSSNTSHLQEIAEHAGIPSYWVDRPERVGPDNRIYSRTSQGEEKVIENWLPSGPITIGLTSGASTPDKVVEDVMERVFMISKLGRLSVA